MAEQAKRERVAIKIGGREYRVRADSDPRHLESVAAFVDGVLRDVQRSTPDTRDAAILAALNIASDLLHMREQLAVVPRERVRALIELVDSA
jgi:cell division protein ZapA (FtsZ GTPase activity inhibitor)